MSFKRGHLRYFVTVADEGQMTRAAAKLHVAQSALSQAIAQLESELGFQLLERQPRGVTLTSGGEAFLPKARDAVASADDAATAAHSLARGVQGVLEFGFVGAPPSVHTPELFAALAETHPGVKLNYREMQFPSSAPASWLADVDVALSHRPPLEANVWVHEVRREPRIALVPRSHRLAGRGELAVTEILEETFIGFDPGIEPWWAGFWSLADHRGGPPQLITGDRVSNTQEFFAMIASGSAITTVPACHAALIVGAVHNVAAIPLRDADPAVLALSGRLDHCNQTVRALLAAAESLPHGRSESGVPVAS